MTEIESYQNNLFQARSTEKMLKLVNENFRNSLKATPSRYALSTKGKKVTFSA